MVKVSASIMCGNPLKFANELKRLEEAKVDMIHFDMMDGHYVSNIAMGLYLLEAMKKNTNIIFDVHLAMWNPDKYLERIAKSGVEIVSVHAESTKHLHRSIQKIKTLGMKASVALNPATPISVLKSVINEIDMVLVMTVNPGFAGQKFIKSQLDKISEIKQMCAKMNPDLLISVDGNINSETIPQCIEAGANVLVAGTSSIFKGEDANYKKLVEIMKRSAKQ